MKKLFLLFAVLFNTALSAQDSVYYQYELQGNGIDSWVKSEFSNGELYNRYMVYENPNKPDWKNLKQDFFHSPLFVKAITQANPNAYSTFLKVLTDGEVDQAIESNLLMMINLMGLSFSVAEKAEINGYFEANNFTIRLQ